MRGLEVALDRTEIQHILNWALEQDLSCTQV